MQYLLGIDAGTTSFKAMLINENGEFAAFSKKTYKLITSNDTFVEFEAEEYWGLLKNVISQLIAESDVNPADIKALSIACQGETLIHLDKNGNPLRNAIVWLDNRAEENANVIKKEFGKKTIYERTGQTDISATWPSSKILWVKRHQKSIHDKTAKFMLLEDYLLYKMTGKFISEKTLMSSTLYLDIKSGGIWKDMLDFMGISEQRLPEIKGCAESIGELTEKAAKELGLDKQTLVITGALDQVASMIGSGSMGKSTVCETTGTCLSVCLNTDKIPEYKATGNMPCHISPIPGQYFLILWSQAAGMVMEWFKNNFVGNVSYELINEGVKNIAAGSDGLLMLPHLSGVAYPDFDPNPKGVFYGIRPYHTKDHFLRAIMESIAYMLKEHVDTAEKAGVNIDEIRSLGGAARSGIWNQIKSDTLNKKIITMDNSETTCFGACILAGKGIGLFDDIDYAGRKFAEPAKIYLPDVSVKQTYERAFSAYKKLNASLESLYSEY